jgi:hypothetical protein
VSDDERQPADGRRVCAYCGTPFWPLRPAAKYCTSLCRRTARDERTRAARRARASDEPRRLTTEERRERFHTARNRGGRCAACSRVLGADETVYIEQFVIGPVGGRGGTAYGPVGVECTSPDFLYETQGQEPERCAGCGRGVYYRTVDVRRHRALCSRWCGPRADAAKRAAPAEEV